METLLTARHHRGILRLEQVQVNAVDGCDSSQARQRVFATRSMRSGTMVVTLQCSAPTRIFPIQAHNITKYILLHALCFPAKEIFCPLLCCSLETPITRSTNKHTLRSNLPQYLQRPLERSAYYCWVLTAFRNKLTNLNKSLFVEGTDYHLSVNLRHRKKPRKHVVAVEETASQHAVGEEAMTLPINHMTTKKIGLCNRHVSVHYLNS